MNLRVRRAILVCVLMAMVGCGGIRLVPVTGKATLNGKPLTGAVVYFNADPAKGNTHRVDSHGKIGADGQYEIYTDEGGKVRKGAPVGWYKVTFLTGLPGAPPVDLDGKYLDFDKTTLSIEVVDDPRAGAYDLPLIK
jgi:hypothetical protein